MPPSTAFGLVIHLAGLRHTVRRRSTAAGEPTRQLAIAAVNDTTLGGGANHP
jgi:hypothetical protein